MLKVYGMSIRPLLDEAEFQKGLELVQARRREKVLRLRHKNDQCRSLAAGLLIRQGFLREGIDYDAVSFGETEHGKPYCADCGIFFNCTHAGEFAAAVFGSREAGIDLECPGSRFRNGERLLAVAKRAFTGEEFKRITERDGDEEERMMEFLKIWTKKESYSKAAGLGLRMDFAGIDTLREGYYHTRICGGGETEPYVLSVCTLDEPEEPVFSFAE